MANPNNDTFINNRPPAEPTSPSVQPIDLIEDRTGQAEHDRLTLYTSRLRQAAVLFLIIYLVFGVRDWVSFQGDVKNPQLLSMLCTIGLQVLLVVVSRTRLLNSSGGRATFEGAMTLVCGIMLDVRQFLHFTNLNWLAFEEVRKAAPIELPILLANTPAINWLVLIVGYSVAMPRPWHEALLVALLMSVNPILVTIIVQATTPTMQQEVDMRFMYAQFGIWSIVSVALACFAAMQTSKLREEVEQARRFGQYHLKSKIGEGGMGEVFLAEHRLLKRPCVIKQIHQNRADDPRVIARFEREVKLLATLTNWHTVEVFDYGRTTDGRFYYVMEYLPGLNLEELVIRYGVLPPERAAYLIAQICLGLHEAHSVGLIHRDIKPSNIVVGPRGGLHDVAKLLDFGLVQGPMDAEDEDSVRLTREGTVVGTVAYMSPEQARGEVLDGRSDMYSLGITLFFLLEGHSPFMKRSPMETLAAHLHDPLPPSSSHISAELREILERCLAKKREARFRDVWELREALLPLGAGWGHPQAESWWASAVDVDHQPTSSQ